MQKHCYLFKVGLDHLTSSQSRCSDADSSRSDGRTISGNAVFIEGDGDSITYLFELGSSKLLWLKIPQHKVILRSPGRKTVPQANELVTQSLCILPHLGRVLMELGSHDLQKLSGNTGNLMLVGSSLKSGENGLVNLVLESTFVTTEEDHTGTRSTERLVGSGGDYITVLKGRLLLLGSHKSRNVSHIHHEKSTVVISNLTEASIVPITRIGRSPSNNHGRLEKGGITLQLIIVDNPRSLIDLIRQTLKVHRSSTNRLPRSLLLGIRVESMSQVSTTWKVQSHDTIMRTEQSSIHRKIRRTSTIRLNIHTPLLLIQPIRL
mmetsp:Transcript_6653/g.14717  ORF Transcript_6653/g.14717 Transcript_6653/m.14717 type:complete len:320 (+) Transcript_6653:358-1317(+)